MPSFVDVTNGNPANGSDIQQVIDALKGTASKGIPLAPTAVNDAVNYALSVKNNEAGASKAFIVYKADGTVLLQVDKNGVAASPDGVLGAGQIITLTGTQTVTNKTLAAPHLTAPVVDSGGLTVTAGDVAATSSNLTAKRLKAAGTTVVIGDFTLSAGWGNTASIGLIVTGSTDQRGQIALSSGGTGIAANPTIVFTFHDGTFGANAFYVANIIDNTGNTAPLGISVAATTVTFTFYGTPVSGRTYTLTWVGMG